jgi:hypothetical protein
VSRYDDDAQTIRNKKSAHLPDSCCKIVQSAVSIQSVSDGKDVIMSDFANRSALNFCAISIASIAAILAANSSADAQPNGKNSKPIAIDERTVEFPVEAGAWVKTDCFEFRAAVRSMIVRMGCTAMAYVAARDPNSKSNPPPYLVVQATSVKNKKTLDNDANEFLRGYVQTRQRDYGIDPRKTGPNDTHQGKYLGVERGQIAGQNAMFFHWGLALNPGVKEIQVGCPAKDAISASPKWKEYSAVSTKIFADLPENRYTSKGGTLVYLIISGAQKDCISPYVNQSLNTLRLL